AQRQGAGLRHGEGHGRHLDGSGQDASRGPSGAGAARRCGRLEGRQVQDRQHRQGLQDHQAADRRGGIRSRAAELQDGAPADLTRLPTEGGSQPPAAASPSSNRDWGQRRPPLPRTLHRTGPVVEYIVVSVLNGVVHGLLLFMVSAGLTLIFGMMGVLNFAHAWLYMLGAYVGFTCTRLGGFWIGIILAPIVAGIVGGIMERYMLRRVHNYGHSPHFLL